MEGHSRLSSFLQPRLFLSVITGHASEHCRRFPERELLDRLHRCESLLRQNSIESEPLHKDPSTTEKKSRNADGGCGGYDSPGDEQPEAAAGAAGSSSPSTTVRSKTVYKTKYALTLEDIYILR
ncbi:hypothetical protein MMC30_002927 [Trapelia coarctata]|nr:hypothetical protein [Trapelia coarctata]